MPEVALSDEEGTHPLRVVAFVGCIVMVATAGLAGCGGGSTPSGQSSRATSVSPTSAPLAEWQKLGATEVPPPSLQRVSLGNIQVVNQTVGVVTDADARSWAQAYMREFGYLEWAVSRKQDAFLANSGLTSALPVFQSNLHDIAEARQTGTRVEYQQESIRRLVVRQVPQGLQPTFQRMQYEWKQYAIFVDALGPVGAIWTDSQGHRTVKNQIPAGRAAFELVGGEFRHDPLMGDVWVVGSDWDCTDPQTVRALAPACNP